MADIPLFPSESLTVRVVIKSFYGATMFTTQLYNIKTRQSDLVSILFCRLKSCEFICSERKVPIPYARALMETFAKK